MDRNRLDWNCDRKAKSDFTASTLNYWRESGAEGELLFWEMTSASTFVPFGHKDAYPQSRFDIYMSYEDRVWYAIELKERNNPSDFKYTVEEGAFMNGEKKNLIQPLKDQGYIPIWCELYTDKKMRIWNLNNIDTDSLQHKEYKIKTVTIDPDAVKITQTRYLLPISAATIIRRYDEQGNC